jgi:hypothetical protein
MSIDCSIPCFVILRKLNSCPSKPLYYKNISQLSYEQLFEFLMVLLSISPYLFGLLLLLICLMKRTTRSISLFSMTFIEVNYLLNLKKLVLVYQNYEKDIKGS